MAERTMQQQQAANDSMSLVWGIMGTGKSGVEAHFFDHIYGGSQAGQTYLQQKQNS
jgi:hypothetical protein